LVAALTYLDIFDLNMKVKFFDICKQVARLSDHPQHKHGAAIVKGNKIISLGFNKNKTNPNSNHIYKTHHAELDVILKSRREDLSDCVLYIYRETKNGELGNSYPCQYCQELLKKVNIKSVCYSTPEGFKESKLA
jgi:deoxycytidylate deaminase